MAVVALLACARAADACTWADCVEQSDAAACRCLANRLRGCSDDACKALAPSESEIDRLIALIEEGREHETDLAFGALRVLDGGDLEDVMQALAGLCADHPHLFLNMVRKHDWSPRRIERLVTMLPLWTVDAPADKLLVVTQRIEGIRGVTTPDLEPVRCATLNALTKYLSELRSQ